ncbi:MAG: hypothetical protein KAQ84_03775 [Thermoplasmatales archaeon]|nr:hypothetical protein [Thermoplasmatales archaeon]
MVKRHVSPLTLREIWDKLDDIDNENKKMIFIALVALGFAFFTVAIPLYYEILDPEDEIKASVAIVYFIIGGCFFYLAWRIKVRKN